MIARITCCEAGRVRPAPMEISHSRVRRRRRAAGRPPERCVPAAPRESSREKIRHDQIVRFDRGRRHVRASARMNVTRGRRIPDAANDGAPARSWRHWHRRNRYVPPEIVCSRPEESVITFAERQDRPARGISLRNVVRQQLKFFSGAEKIPSSDNAAQGGQSSWLRERWQPSFAMPPQTRHESRRRHTPARPADRRWCAARISDQSIRTAADQKTRCSMISEICGALSCDRRPSCRCSQRIGGNAHGMSQRSLKWE